MSRPRRSPAAGGLVGRYMLRLLAKPLLATLLVLLPALLMERLLRLFDLLAGTGGPVSSVARLLLYLVPHYLGLALPAALFAGVYMVVARLSEDHEMDALQSVGFSLARLSRPFLLVGLLFAAAGVGLYGYAQPLGRYAYRASFHALTQAVWNGSIVPGEFVRIGGRAVATADGRDRADGLLRGVFVQQRRPDGTEVLTTAATGRFALDPGAGEYLLELERGQQITLSPNGDVSSLSFAGSDQSRPVSVRLPGFRPRGADEREMTLGELWAARHGPEPRPAAVPPPTRLDGELHGRLVRAASLAVLPLLAVPMGLAAKRSRRFHGIALATLILVLYQQALQLLESLGDVGRVDARPGLWAVFLLFAAFCAAVFRRSSRNPAEGGFDGALAAIERGALSAAALLPRRWRPSP